MDTGWTSIYYEYIIENKHANEAKLILKYQQTTMKTTETLTIYKFLAQTW